MTLNEQLLEFVDGSLNPDQEAELLHRLSVSPERRSILRNFLNQKAIFAQDRLGMQVPYAAEAGLWSKLDALMPVAIATGLGATAAGGVGAALIEGTTETVAVGAAPGFFAQAFSSASMAVAAATLFMGLGLGYFFASNADTRQIAAHDAAPVISRTSELHQSTTEAPETSGAASASIEGSNQNSTTRIIYRNTPMYGSPWPLFGVGAGTATPQPVEEEKSLADIPVAQGKSVSTMPVLRVGEDKLRPVFSESGRYEAPPKTLLQRFEFSFSESFGRQFPNTTATNVSMPFVTNSAVSAFFQVLPRSNALWVGASAGTANITHKTLFTRSGNPLDPMQQVLESDLSHVQTNWVGGFIQGRTPILGQADLMATLGYGIASAGKMWIGEVGIHYDATREVGFQVGVRALRLTYDLTQEKNDLVTHGNGSLVVPSGVLDVTPSYNVELNTGLYFHF